MPNKLLFPSAQPGKTPPPADATTHHGTSAYARTNEEALAQFAVTGCFRDTFYTDAKTQLEDVIRLCHVVDDRFVAQCAVYSRKRGYMKDVPAFLLAYLASPDTKDKYFLKKVFFTVIDNPKMLRNFVQIIRSGATGRKSLGTIPKQLVQKWLHTRTNDQLIRASVGNDPSLADVIKMVHPKPRDAENDATYAYILGKAKNEENLPDLIKKYEIWKKDPVNQPIPSVPWLMLTANQLDKKAWQSIARQVSWRDLRANLNTFQRHQVFDDPEMVKYVASKLRDKAEIKKSKVFPYQIFAAYANSNVCWDIKNALIDAMEIAVQNVPAISGQLVIAVDVSASMRDPITGSYNPNSNSKIRYVDVAALFTACIVQKNPKALVLPFHGYVLSQTVNPRDTIMTNAEKLASLCNNGTCCAAPLAHLNKNRIKADTVIYFSDNESWMDIYSDFRTSSLNWPTETMAQWNVFKIDNKNAKLICVDLSPRGTTQAKNSADILNIGGFSDTVFDCINDFIQGNHGSHYWVSQIKKIDLESLDKERN